MKTLIALILVAASVQSVAAWARYYDGESAAFVLIDEKRIEDLRDGRAVLNVAIRPPATWMGVKGHRAIEIAGFPIHVLDKIKEMDGPAFFVFYSDRTKLTDQISEAPDAVRIGGAIDYKVGILTATQLIAVTGEKIILQSDVSDRIEAYRKVINSKDQKERDFYLGVWGMDNQTKLENKSKTSSSRKPSD